jgi:glutamate synthase (ferredoxin)
LQWFRKGLSGAKLIVSKSSYATFKPEENIIIKRSPYGAITGEAYINGMAGERFWCKKSACLEGIGRSRMWYMTGGIVVVLENGRNFAAGMSGGIAYIFDAWKNSKWFMQYGNGSLRKI